MYGNSKCCSSHKNHLQLTSSNECYSIYFILQLTLNIESYVEQFGVVLSHHLQRGLVVREKAPAQVLVNLLDLEQVRGYVFEGEARLPALPRA